MRLLISDELLDDIANEYVTFKSESGTQKTFIQYLTGKVNELGEQVKEGTLNCVDSQVT